MLWDLESEGAGAASDRGYRVTDQRSPRRDCCRCGTPEAARQAQDAVGKSRQGATSRKVSHTGLRAVVTPEDGASRPNPVTAR